MGSTYWESRARLSRRRVLKGTGALASGAAALALIGCGDDDDDAPTATATTPASTATGTASSSASATATGTQAGPEPERGGILQRARTNDLTRDPLTLSAGTSQSFGARVYSGLFRHAARADWQEAFSYNPEPDAALEYEQVDETTYTFKLNPEVKFHNVAPVNGRRMVADDVVKSVERFLAEPKNALATDYRPLMNVPTAIDEDTVQFTTKRPYAPFLTHLIAFRPMYVYPSELVANDELRSSTPIGSGPFIFKNQQSGALAEFDANPAYHLKDAAGWRLPFVDGLRESVVPEAVQFLVQFVAGNIDYHVFTGTEMEDVESQAKDIQKLATWSGANTSLSPQLRSGPLVDPNLRIAASRAINRDAILEAGTAPGFWANYIPPPMGKWFLDPKGMDAGPGAANLAFDPAEARKLLDASGAADETFDFTYTNGYGQAHINEALLIIDQMRQAGFKLNPKMADYRTEYIKPGGEGVMFGDYSGFMFKVRGNYPHPAQAFAVQLRSGGTYAEPVHQDAALDKMIDDLSIEFDDDAQLEQTFEIQRYGMEKMYWITSVQNHLYAAAQKWVNQFTVDSLYASSAEEYLWLSKDR